MALAGSASAVLMSSSAYAQQAATRTYAIPAGPLGTALTAFASASDITLSFSAEQTRGLQSEGLKGSYTVDGGLARLLAGSGLEAAHRGGGNYVLQKLPTSAVLPEVKVTAAAGGQSEAELKEYGYRVKSSSATGFREKAVIDTPFSVTTISSEVMQDQQARSLVDVVKNDPSVSQATDPFFYDRVNVRGFNLSVDAIYRDGLTINDQGSIALDNKAAVEIVKGLSAMRYGFTSPGGVVNYVVKRPTSEPLSRVTLLANEYGGYGASGDFSRRFGDQKEFGVRINVASEELRTHVNGMKGDLL
jgi:iron complex outermembrane receptor protein